MSVTRYKYGYRMDATGDTISERLIVRKMYVKGGSSAGDFIFKDGNGNTIPPTITEDADTDKVFDYPFSDHLIDGLELDSLPSGGAVEILID